MRRFNVTAFVSNCLDNETVSTEILTVQPVTNMELIVEPQHASVTSTDGVTVKVSMEFGTAVTLAIDYGDGSDNATRRTGAVAQAEFIHALVLKCS